MKIRKIEPQDRAGLKALLNAQKHFKPEEIKVALELIDIVLTHPSQEDYIIRIAEEPAGEVLGYICDGKAPLTDAVYDIYWIVVHPAFWNQGLGSSLLHQTEADLKRRHARLLLIETSSKPSYEAPRAFYQKHGYQEQARILDYYAVGDHKLIFGKTLTS
jgi:ribosomal protein S18 acetylase RimI-like enzyme